ncbi:MAG: diadenylate cyclase [Mariniblastus sp.]|jgi:diadenylate cyclase|nr:diadenylate cyclase [Mariniblastus sp.]MDB4370743.1 diadenylate cyclase [Mariniblastus sp.]MDG1510858.1 diadenylate cyclase [Mariniblastus sp.]MDG2180410.1 diadenylate cyclase [Mariniblastus sp.]|eukprot:COSAG01_NODE_660_length_14430_cov_1850.793385_4_plen_310_part_00
MSLPKKHKSFFSFVDAGVKLVKASDADALLVLMEKQTDWARLKRKSVNQVLIIATHDDAIHASATEAEIHSIHLEMPEASVQNQLTQAVLASVASEKVKPGSTVVAIYSGFDTEDIDTISVLKLTEHLGRLTARDLRKLETKVPLDTLKAVVDLAVAIGREGREGKAVGTMFIVGDHRKVLDESRPAGFDLVKGYTRKERNIFDGKVREGIKEIAQLDGMFIISSDGTVEGSSRIIDTSPVEITMTKGLGSRHFSGAAISKNTKAIAVIVSQTNGTVRIFQNGEVVLRIEPLQRAMKWKDLDSDHPDTD